MIEKLKIMYGITPVMQQCIKNACHELDIRSIKDILDSVSDIPTFTQPEINIMLFEIGREYEKRRIKC
ncbi:MAG: hypothetical protein MUO21_02660 [Nitrososphaeraceae archaeon]|nr:hypothetical protein [Nitrososphaeraceae archaeon]